ncbi:TetR/AcrR family transcriptional regulator, partial [Pseudonocardia sp.]|uniref:TetR/AcrR family transcriptional regulator n=1 Tax=Pseudonocardia sp. TaxID=60912 RepID=UPI0031FD5833
RSQIAAAAQDLALEQGLAATTMGAIAKRVNVSRATVYNYFSDVEEALLWVVEQEVGLFVATTRRELVGDPVDQLRAMYKPRSSTSPARTGAPPPCTSKWPGSVRWCANGCASTPPAWSRC